MGVVAKMKQDEITIKFDDLKKEKAANFKERIWFIKYWVKFMKEHSDKEWSKGQAMLIDSQIQHSRQFYKNLEKTEDGRKILEILLEEMKRINRR